MLLNFRNCANGLQTPQVPLQPRMRYNAKEHEIYFDAWWARTSPAEVDRIKNLMALRKEFLPQFANALEERELSVRGGEGRGTWTDPIRP